MPLEGLRWSRDSGSALYDTPPNGRSRTGWGAYNPETRETARNQSGSFYTPREIVQFMVNESLVAHLKATVGEQLEEQYRQLLDFTTEDIVLPQFGIRNSA